MMLARGQQKITDAVGGGSGTAWAAGRVSTVFEVASPTQRRFDGYGSSLLRSALDEDVQAFVDRLRSGGPAVVALAIATSPKPASACFEPTRNLWRASLSGKGTRSS